MDAMAKAAPEDHEKLRELQASLRRALHHWDATDTGQQTAAFSRIVPAADDLLAEHHRRVQRQVRLRASRKQDWTGRILLALAAVLLLTVILLGVSMWWALLALPLLGFGLSSLVMARGTHG
jgi:Flp pilus assembly protein TadB